MNNGNTAGLAWNMKKGDKATLSTKAGQKATLTYEEDGTYSLVIPNAEADEDVVVDWRKTTADILVSKIWDDEDDKDGIRKYTYDSQGPWPRLRLQWSIDGGNNWQYASIESDYLDDPDTYIYLRTAPLGWDAEDGYKYKDGTYETDGRLDKEQKEDRPIHTWPFLPVYTYDANGNVDRPILYRILEGSLDDLKENDFDGKSPALTDYEEPVYSPGQVFTLTSEETKTKDGWPIYRDSSNKDYILKNGKYYEVTNWVAADAPADAQPDPDNLHAVTEHDKKIIDGQQVVRNPLGGREYIAKGTEYYEVVYDVVSSEAAFDTSTYSTDKSVNPDYDHTDPNTPDVRTFSEVTLGGYTTADTAVVTFNADVMNKHTPTNVYVDVQKEWNDGDLFGQETTETDGNKYERPDITFTLHGTIVNKDGKTIDVDLDPDPDLTDRTITLSPNETGAKDDDESADGSAYKIDDDNFGVIFRNLPQYQEGRLIEYTVTESFDNADAWTATGGTITAAKSGDTTTGYTLSDLKEVNEDGEHKGYTGSFVNTPVVDDKYEKLPVTIVKQDANDPNSRIEGATFTVYTNPTDKVEPETSFYKQIDGLTVWRYSWNNNVQFVLKDGKYYRVLNDGSIADTPVANQPSAANLTKVINDVDAPVDEIHVITDADGSATINFRQTGTYYVVETKAPEGYEADTTVYKFVVDKELKTVTLEESDTEHETHWWQRLRDLVFGDGTNEEDNWKQDENKRGGTLTVKDEPIKANVLVRKTWEDDNNRDGLRPVEDEDTMPQVWLQRQVNDGEWKNVDLDTWEKRDISDTDGIIVENPEDHFTWENLPAYENGQPIKYRVVEADADGTTDSVITGDALTAYSYNAQTVSTEEKEFYLLEAGADVKAKNRTVNVTNTHTPQTISLNASKHWNDESNDEKQRPTNVTLSLYKLVDGVETYVADIPLDGAANTISDAVKELEPTGEGNTWNGEVGKLPAYENGQPITYVLREPSVPTHYSDTYAVSYTKTDGSSGDASGTSAINAASIKRSFKTEDETTTETTSASIMVTNTINMEIPVQKTWVDGANANVTYTLFRTTKAEAELEDSKYKQVDSTIDSSKKVTTWSPYAADGTTLVDGWEQVSAAGEVTIGSYHFKTVGAADGGDTYGDSPDEAIAFPVRVPEYAPDGTKYLYRILETPAGSASFEADYATDGRKVTNTNALTGTVYANVNVVKELQGRNWVNVGKENADRFYFNIEAVGGKFITGNGNDHNDNDAVAKADVPLPTDGDPATTDDSVGQANTGTAKVGAIGRNVPFNPIAFNTDNTKMGNGETVEYEYKVYESDANGNRITQQTIDGVTYEGSASGGTFTSSEHKLRVRVSRDASGVFAAPEIFWDDSTTASAVPVFTNTYEASTELHGLIVKQVNGREIVGSDSFLFKVSNLSGGVMRPSQDDEASLDPREVDAATITRNTGSKVTSDTTSSGKDFKPEAGNGGNYRAIRTSTATIIKSSDLAQVTSDGKATDTFIYEFYEDGNSSRSDKDDLTPDSGKVYLKAVVTDNQDGTLDVKTSYWRDATCTKDEVDARVLVYAADDGTHKAGELAPSGADPQEAAYTYVPAALFVNSETLDIPVKKVWQGGPATEDVTLHLKRHLFALTEEGRLDGAGDGNGASYVEIQESVWVAEGHDASSFWETVGLVYTAPRGDFLNSDGTPKYDSAQTSDSSKTYTDIEGFNKDLPMYVTKADVNGNPVTYRAVYKLVEDDTSDAYETTYDNQVFINSSSGTLSVTNKVVATNTANIAAVKQLLGRNWTASDDFAFTLTPTGKATYDANGEINGTDTRADTLAKIPVPKTDADRDSSTTGQVATTHAKQDESTYPVVDQNGGLERLARFGTITYTVDDLVYDEKDGHMQGDFFYEMREDIPVDAKNGITYDGSVHTVHVKVRENRTDTLVVQVAYDEETPGDISTGTQFTPVYTNRYSAEATATVTIDKHIMGRNWKADDAFDFIMNPVGGAPFRDADASEFPAKEDDDGTDEKVQAALEGGLAAHTERFAHIKRMNIDADNVGTSNAQSMAMPKLAFTYSDLNLTVTEDDALYYGNVEAAANKVPAGTAYGQFVYAIEETKYKSITPDAADLDIDTDTEYARITVIDKGDGTLDTFVEIFEDRYCTVPRYVPADDGSASTTPATAVTFVNQLKRDLTVTKAWADPAIGDVTLRLQWSTDGAHWYNVDGTTWFPNVEGTKTIAKDASGADLGVTWTGLPAYANISEHDDRTGRTADDKDLNDSWLYYQVVEDRVTNITTRYSETPYAQGDTLSTKVTVNGEETNKYSTDPFHTGAEKDDAGNWVTERVKNLYVTNFPDDFEDAVTFGVVKQYIGKVWEDETFTFKAEPVKAKLGDDDYIDEGTDGYHMPRMQNNTATASAQTREVSVNEHAANFGSLTIKQSDLARVTADGDPDKGKDRGEFIYKITEVAPDDAAEITEDGKAYRLATDSKGNKIKYTTEEHTVKIVAISDGTKITFTVSYDDRETGQFVPVYTNYAMVPTPLEGTKTWVGGPATEQENGTVTLSNGDSTVTDATDSLGLVLQRSSAKTGSTTQTVATDDAGRDLVIVWAKQTEEQTGTYTSYEPTADTAVNDAKTYYSDEDGSGEYTAVTPAGGENPSGEGWYELVETPTYATKYTKQETGDATYTVMAKDGNGSFVDPMLSLVDSEGYAYTYSIAEPTAPTGYKVTAAGMDVTNTYDQKDSLKVTKTWDDATDAEGLRPEQVIVHLYKKIEADSSDDGSAEETTADDFVQVEIERKIIKKGDEETGVTWDNLPIYENGKKITYIVIEENEYGYTTTYSYNNGTENVTDGKDAASLVLDGEDGAQTITVKNSLVPATSEVKVSKTWDDNDNAQGKRPKEVTFELYKYVWDKEDKAYKKNDSAVATLTLNGSEENSWSGSWKNLPMTENGKTVLYVVEEDTEGDIYGAPGTPGKYSNTPCITGDQVNGFTVRNIFTSDTVDLYGEITITKRWADDALKNTEGYARPTAVAVQLYANETAVGDEVALSDANDWSATWNDLPVNDGNQTITYTVAEVDVPKGYISTVEGSAADGFIITNTAVSSDLDVDAITIALTKRSDNDRLLSGATFTLTKPDGTTQAFTTGADGTITIPFVVTGDYKLRETEAPDGYELDDSEYSIAVSKELVEVRLNAEDNAWDKIYRLIFRTGDDYMQIKEGSDKTVTIGNSPQKHNLTVTKNYSGIDALPDTFTITVNYTDAEGTLKNVTLTPEDAGAVKAQGSVTWTVANVPYDSVVTAAESGYEYEDYKVNVGDASQTITMPDADQTVSFTNVYTEPEKVTVTYDADNGTEANVTTIKRGANEPAQPADPTKSGYTFMGWSRTQDADGNVVYKANWEEIPDVPTVTVTYDADNNTTPKVTTITKGGNEPAQPADPTKAGYKFMGWQRAQDDTTGNVVYTAKWEEIPEVETITVTYKDSEGNTFEPVTTTVNKGDNEPAQPADPTRTGYIFGGWKRVQDTTTGNVVYEAQWVPEPTVSSITVTYDPDNGSDPTPTTIERDANEPTQPADPTRAGYKFTGWQRTQDATTGNVTYKARWEKLPDAETITVTYDADNGTDPKVTTIEQDANEPAQPADPTKDGYTFMGWSRTQDADGNVVYKAKWEKIPDVVTVTVTYDADNDTAPTVTTITKGANEPAQPADPTKSGYTFTGWSRTQDADGNVVYKASWEKIPDVPTVTVTYDADNNTTPKVTTITKGANEPAQPADPTKAGYKFMGWQRTQDDTTGNVVYTAKWEEIPDVETITVTYKDSEGNTFEPVTTTVNKGDNEPAQPADPTRTGYIFGGWKRVQDTTTGNVVYEAQWVPEPTVSSITVTYDPDNGSDPTPTTIERDANEPTQPADPTREGYKFTGWQRTQDATTGNVTYKARWEKIPDEATVTVTYDADNGTTPTVTTITKGANEPTQPADPTKDGNKFMGWSRTQDADGNVVYKAKWEKIPDPVQITVTYTDGVDDEELFPDNESTINRGEDEPAQPTNPTRTGYTFGGWLRSVDDNGNVTYKANWIKDPDEPTPVKITVTYDPDNGSDKKTTTIDKGDNEPDQPKAPEKEGYTFGGWLREIDKDGNVTYTANWIKNPVTPTPDKISITYEFANGDDPETTEIERGKDEPVQPEEPEREGYTFGGWLRSVDTDTGNVTYTASWIENPGDITVTYDADNGTDPDVKTINKLDNEPAQPANPTKSGYTFTGWTRTVNPDTGNVTYKASWTPVPEADEITVTYNPDNGEDVTSTTIKKGDNEPAQPTNPTRTGYTFGGWLREVDKDGNVTYTAHWIKDPEEPVAEQITVIYKDGEKIVVSEPVNKGDREPDQPDDPEEREGYTFGGWDKTQDDDGNITYTARWNEVTETPDPPAPGKVTVTYVDGQGKTLFGPQEFNKGDEEPAYTTYPEREGFIFGGWIRSTDDDGNITYTARWIEDKVIPDPVDVPKTITFIDPMADNVVLKSLDEDADGANVKPTDPSHDGLQFTGWKEAKDKNGNTIITASYKSDCANPQNEIMIRYRDINDGNETVYQTSYILEDEDEPAAPADPVKDGFTFNGWEREEFKDNDGKVTSVIYTAKWTEVPVPVEKTHWVTYVDPDGSTIYLEKVTVKDGDKEPDAPSDPTKDDQIFGGWVRSVDDDGNVTYTAKWIPIVYTVTFVDGRTGEVIDKADDIVPHGSADVPKVNEHEGYEFKGWRTPAGELVTELTVTDVTRDLVYTAVYEPVVIPDPIVHTVTFIDARTGDELKIDRNVADGGSTTVPPVKEYQGYVFKGWWTLENTLVTELEVKDVREDQTYVALYDRVYEVYDQSVTGKRIIHFRYNDKNGSEVMEDRVDTVKFTRTATIDAVTGETTFSEWTPRFNTFPEEDVPVVDGYTPDRDKIPEITIYPNGKDEEIWVIYTPPQKRTITITYVDPDGTVYQQHTVEHGEAEPEAPKEIIKDAFIFDGWDRSEDADGNVTYTAKWIKDEKPTEPVDPTEPVKPTEPENQTDPAEPEKPTEPVKPTEPTEPTKPVEPDDHNDPTEPTDSAKPADSGKETVTTDKQSGQTVVVDGQTATIPAGASSTVVTNPATGTSTRVFLPDAAAAPATGDANENVAWIAAAIAAVAGMAAAAVVGRRRKE